MTLHDISNSREWMGTSLCFHHRGPLILGHLSSFLELRTWTLIFSPHPTPTTPQQPNTNNHF